MNVLTHEEAKKLRDSTCMNDPLALIHATELAVLAKLSQGVSVEPDLTACKVRGYLGPGMMCGQVIVGDKSCGNRTSPCEYKAPYFTADQLQAAIAAARVAAINECAKVCMDLELADRYKSMVSTDDWNAGTLDCESAIRNLIGGSK